MAAMAPEWSWASRCAMNAPLEWPMMKTRRSSMAYFAFTASMMPMM